MNDFDSYFNITTELDWMEVIRANNLTIAEVNIEIEIEIRENVKFLDIKNRRYIIF